MNNPCNQISLDEAALMAILRDEAQNALELEGRKLLNHMRQEVQHTVDGGGPGKPDWRKTIAANLDRLALAVSDTAVSMDFGYSPSGKADLVRAMIVEAGSGSAVGNAPIHAGPTGRSVWNDDVSGQHPSRAKTEYLLPAEFNQKGNQFVENAMRIMETAYGDITEFVFATVPDNVYYGNVQVSSR